MYGVWFSGGSQPIREALTARFALRQIDMLTESPDMDDIAEIVALTVCSTDDDWRLLGAQAGAGFLGCVALIDQLDIKRYRQALRLGAGVVHIDTSTEIIADVVIAAGEGEAVLPMEVARLIAGGEFDANSEEQLDFIETELLRAIALGDTIVAIADRYHYSERTIRRRLQSAFVKLKVENRAEAIRAIDRLGLV